MPQEIQKIDVGDPTPNVTTATQRVPDGEQRPILGERISKGICRK
jgi:hypothetical protein